MICDAKRTQELWEEFLLKYRDLFPKEWTIRLYAKLYVRAEVIPDMSKPQHFVVRLGHDKAYYERAAQKIKELNIKG